MPEAVVLDVGEEVEISKKRDKRKVSECHKSNEKTTTTFIKNTKERHHIVRD